MSSTSPSRADVYERVTNRILADLEAGTRSWQKPWSAGNTDGQIVRPLRHNGLPYNGINILLLWGAAIENGYAAARWMTFRQATELGGCVRKGEHGSLVVYADRITRTEQNETGEDVERQIPFMKGYTVFNVEQIGGLPESYYDRPAAPKAAAERHAQAEGFIAGTSARIAHGGNRAFYAPAADRVQMPPYEAFKDQEAYYATALHELTHWTGHTSRNARAFGKRFADEAYAFEELVAELGSAFLCCDLSITPEVRDDHAGYLAHWISILKADKRAIFTAASHASKAVDFLHGLQTKREERAA
jgi:antirestriction protein ArdC